MDLVSFRIILVYPIHTLSDKIDGRKSKKNNHCSDTCWNIQNKERRLHRAFSSFKHPKENRFFRIGLRNLHIFPPRFLNYNNNVSTVNCGAVKEYHFTFACRTVNFRGKPSIWRNVVNVFLLGGGGSV